MVSLCGLCLEVGEKILRSSHVSSVILGFLRRCLFVGRLIVGRLPTGRGLPWKINCMLLGLFMPWSGSSSLSLCMIIVVFASQSFSPRGLKSSS